jgi:anti-sigma regulatory factor (Ser/Thr protein kinase)/nucleoid DNA-binding protein
VKTLAADLGGDADAAEQRLLALIQAMKDVLAGGKNVLCDGFAKIKLTGSDTAPDISASSDEFTEILGKGAGMKAADAGAFTETVLGKIKTRLLAGDKIFLKDFVSLRVVEEKPKIVEDPITKQRMIQPAKNVISFGTHASIKTLVPGGGLAFIPSVSLKEEMQKIKTSAILLAVPESDFFSKTIEYHFNRAGWKVKTATGVTDALQVMDGGETYLVICDHNMADAQKLAEKLKCKKETSLIPLIMMLPKNTNLDHAEYFRICGDEQVVEPFEVKSLLDIAESELARSSEEATIFDQEVVFQFPTDDQNIEKANELGATLFESSGLSDEGQVALAAAFREGIGNGAQHGNRHRRDKHVEIRYLLDSEKITASIEDQGNGFDWRQFIERDGDAVDRVRAKHQGQMGGLGIMLMLKCVDYLEYNDKGNRVTLQKFLKPRA